MKKEPLLKTLSAASDAHLRLGAHPEYRDGIKHIRSLVDQTFAPSLTHSDLNDFVTGIICAIQPADSKYCRELTPFEQGCLGCAYLLYTASDPPRVKLPL